MDFKTWIKEEPLEELFGFGRSQPQPAPQPPQPPQPAAVSFQITEPMKQDSRVFADEIFRQLNIGLQAHLERARQSAKFKELLRNYWGAARGFLQRDDVVTAVNQALGATINMKL